MAISWSRVAELGQKSTTLVLMGMTVVGVTMVAQGGYGVVQRKKERERKSKQEATTDASQTQQVHHTIIDQSILYTCVLQVNTSESKRA